MPAAEAKQHKFDFDLLKKDNVILKKDNSRLEADVEKVKSNTAMEVKLATAEAKLSMQGELSDRFEKGMDRATHILKGGSRNVATPDSAADLGGVWQQ